MADVMTDPAHAVNWLKITCAIASGFCMGVGVIGPSIGQGYIGGKACESIGRKPESFASIQRAMILGMLFTESSSIYVLITCLILLFLYS